MKKGIRIIKIILIIVIIVGLILLALYEWQEYVNRQESAEARELAATTAEATPSQVPTPPPMQDSQTGKDDGNPPPRPTDPVVIELMNTNLTSLREINPEVIGWIYIPDTKVDYPIVKGENNEYYLHNSWKNTKSGAGAIFMEQVNSPDMKDFNTIIYGHNMRSKSMFGGLSRYKSPTYLKEHPSIYVATDTGVYRYDIFAAHQVGVKTIIYRTELDEPLQREEFIHFSLDYSVVDTDIVPTVDDKILTLSTCSGSGYSTRWVVQGILNESASFIK